jgi:hypothetical protein
MKLLEIFGLTLIISLSWIASFRYQGRNLTIRLKTKNRVWRPSSSRIEMAGHLALRYKPTLTAMRAQKKSSGKQSSYPDDWIN